MATHGRVTDENAHPHLSASGRVAIVHNGIIDNYHALKQELIQKGIVFKSETDSEVIAHLIESYLLAYPEEGPEEAVRRTLARLVGTYGIIAVFSDPAGTCSSAPKTEARWSWARVTAKSFWPPDPAAFIGSTKKRGVP